MATVSPSAGESAAAAAGGASTAAPHAVAGADSVAIPDAAVVPDVSPFPDAAAAPVTRSSPTFDAGSSVGQSEPEAESASTPEVPAAAVVEPSAVAEAPSAAPIDVARASSSAGDTLDFAALVARLRKTKAINLVTKVAVKNQSNDLLDEFRAYHTRHGTATLAELRRSYDSLFSRLHSLLEDADPPLARDVDRSRAAIWEILSDPSKFTASHLMSGA
jgi:hypothetical protein